ncbi:MAG: complex I subunit 4 family protein [Candidatus Aquicultorales bacterium]
MNGIPVLTILVALPIALTIATLLIPSRYEKAIKITSIAGTGLIFAYTIFLLANFKLGTTEMQFVEKFDWVKVIGMKYYLGVDGFSIPIIFLTGLLTFLCAIYSWRMDVQVKSYFFLLALLEIGMLGVFVALDYVIFYIFWEIVLVPMFFFIGIWGGENRKYASIKFFLYTLVGSVLMLLSILLLYFYGPHTFDMMEIAKWGQAGKYALSLQYIMFWGLFIGFAVKVPVFPFHTWLPDAHVEAPTVGSVLLAGVLLKMGGYGFIRILLPTLPQAFSKFAIYLAVLGVINIVYGAALALAQKDMKKMVAYSSIGHMGFVVLGVAAGNAAGLDGAVLQMFTHGIITGMLFFLVGMVYERYHTKEIAKLSGLATAVPAIAVILVFASFASLGLPSLAGFVGEFLSLLGGFEAFANIAAISVLGIVLTAAYFLRMLQQVVFNPSGNSGEIHADMYDIQAREITALVPLMAFALFLGVYPHPFLEIVNPAAQSLVKIVGG